MASSFTEAEKYGTRAIQMRNIPAGKGGTFKLAKPLAANVNSPAAVRAQQYDPLSSRAATGHLPFGTRNCYTCVGLCFPIPNTDRLFVAHINAFVRAPIVHDTLATTVVRKCSVEEGLAIQREIRDRLRQRFKKGFWKVDEIEKSKVEIVCPWPTAGGQQITGHYVVAAVREFLEMPGGRSCDRQSHGLLCDRQSGAVQRLSNVDFAQEWFEVRTWEQEVGGEHVRFTAIDVKAEELEEWKVELYRND